MYHDLRRREGTGGPDDSLSRSKLPLPGEIDRRKERSTSPSFHAVWRRDRSIPTRLTFLSGGGSLYLELEEQLDDSSMRQGPGLEPYSGKPGLKEEALYPPRGMRPDDQGDFQCEGGPVRFVGRRVDKLTIALPGVQKISPGEQSPENKYLYLF